jgi:hypothetical protein
MVNKCGSKDKKEVMRLEHGGVNNFCICHKPFVINTDTKGYFRSSPHIKPYNINAPPYVESLSSMVPQVFYNLFRS